MSSYIGPHFGFPGLLSLGDGHLIIVYNDQAADGAPTRSIHTAISLDGGGTWTDGPDVFGGVATSPPTTDASASKQRWSDFHVASAGASCGSVTRDGTLLVSGSLSMTTSIRPLHYVPVPCVWRSTDRGVVWFCSTHPLRDHPGNGDISSTGLTADVAAPDITGYGTSPPVQLSGGDHDGRLLCTVYGKRTPGSANVSVTVISSDDDGSTWTLLSNPADGDELKRNFAESCLAGLDDGSVYLMHRVGATVGQLVTEWREFQRSFDGGLTWSPPTRLPFPGGQSGRPDVLQISRSSVGNGWGDLIHFLRPRDFQRYILFSISHDRGDTWSPLATFAAGYPGEVTGPGSRSSYAQPAEIAPGEVGVAYALESNPSRAPDYPGARCSTRFKRVRLAR